MADRRAYGILVVWLALFCDYALMTVVIPIFPTLGASEFATGLLFSGKAMLQVLSVPFVAKIVDGQGLKPLVVGLCINLTSNLVFAMTSDYNTWLFARAVQGLASSCILCSGFLHIQQLHPVDSELGEAMGVVTTGIITGVTVGPPVGGVLFAVQPQAPFIVLSGVLLLVSGLTVLYMVKYPMERGQMKRLADNDHDEDDETAKLPHQPESAAQKVWELLTDPHILVALGALWVANAVIACLESTLGYYLENEMHLTPGEVGLVYMVTAIPSVIGAKVSGGFGNRFGRARVIQLGMVMQGAFFALGPKDSVPVEVISLVGLGFGMGLVDGCAPAMLAYRTETAHGGTGVVYTLSSAATQLGFIAGPLSGSALMEVLGFQVMTLLLGVAMVMYAPLLRINYKFGGGNTSQEPAAKSPKADEMVEIDLSDTDSTPAMKRDCLRSEDDEHESLRPGKKQDVQQV